MGLNNIDKLRAANTRITELETQLKVAQETIADLREYNERAPRLAVEVEDRRIAELEARLTEAEETYQRLMNNITQLEARAEKAEARLKESEGWRLKAERRLAERYSVDYISLENKLAEAEARAEAAEANGVAIRNQWSRLECQHDLAIERADRAEADAGRLQSIVGDFMTDYLETHEECNCGGCTFCYAKAALRPAEAGEEEK